jgi:peptide deformylase
MAILPIRTLGDPVLREPSRPVELFDSALAALVGDMFDTMYDAPGVGLAAPQIGRSLRLFVYDDREESGEGKGVLANPGLVVLEEDEEQDEGCLSIPGLFFPTTRATRVVVRGQRLDGAPVQIEALGLLARIMQHETDHVNGMLFIDRLSGEARKEAMRAIRERELEISP